MDKLRLGRNSSAAIQDLAAFKDATYKARWVHFTRGIRRIDP
ncbi:hypothetical protein [Rathayibacter soli]|nr:hypothetical protein [Glaciibacter superstes]